MKRGGSAAEVETALALAQKLAMKNGIDFEKVKEDEYHGREPITHGLAFRNSRIQTECKYVGLILNRFFNIKTLLSSYGLIFIGTKTNIEIAKYIYTFLVRHFRNEWKTKHGRLRKRDSFFYGMYLGIITKLEKEQPKPGDEEGIILATECSRIEEYKNRIFGNLEKKEIKSGNDSQAALSKGYDSGRQTEIRKAVKNNESMKLLEV
jgi:hypothetical protein